MGTPQISLIMTRPAEANARFADLLPPALHPQLTVIESPLTDIVPLAARDDLTAADVAVFTSVNGVRFAPDGDGRQAFCVGRRTTEVAQAAGWQAIFGGETADDLVAFLKVHPPKSALWHIAGRHTRGQVVDRLVAQGVTATGVTVYDQLLKPLTQQAREALQRPEPVIVPVFSPRTAARFAQECPKDAHPHVVALSRAVAAPMTKMDLATLEVAARPDAQAMVQCLEKLVARVSLG